MLISPAPAPPPTPAGSRIPAIASCYRVVTFVKMLFRPQQTYCVLGTKAYFFQSILFRQNCFATALPILRLRQ